MSSEIYIVSVVVERFKTDPGLHSGERYSVVDSSDVGEKNYPTYEEAEEFAAELRQRAQDMCDSDWREPEWFDGTTPNDWKTILENT